MSRFYYRIFILLAVALLSVIDAAALSDRTPGIIKSSLMGLEYDVRAGLSIGGATPIPLPREIREIESFNPSVNLSIGGNVKKWFGKDKKWGVTVGVRLETKSMETGARVNNYGMEILGDGGERLKGNWTGHVKTKFRETMVTVPVSAAFNVSRRVALHAGPYVSFVTGKDFSGHVYDGYLRENNPTGNKVVFEDDNQATYDFSDDLRTFQAGLQAGVDWKAFRHLIVCGELSWGLNNIFKSDFKTITFNMYPVYVNIGFGYAF